MKYCTACGEKLDDQAKFCWKCGEKQVAVEAGEVKQEKESIFDSLTGSVNRMTGGKKKAVHPPMRKLFSRVFEKHPQEEAETIFASGVPETIPSLTSEQSTWPQPWLWSRVLFGLGLAFFMLMLCCEVFDNITALPGTIILGSFMVPVAVLVFFFELNAPKNISFYTVLKVFLVGGCASILLTLLLGTVFEIEGTDFLQAIITGIVEELGKAGIVAYFISHTKNAKYHINGLLIGAAVGAGFAAFESSGYALVYLLAGNFDVMLDVIFLRGVLAPGGHVVWAAMAGYAMMLAKEDEPMSWGVFRKKQFWKIFWLPIAMHAVWDMPILNTEFPVIQVLLCVAAWVVIFVFIDNSLSQLAQVAKESAANESAIESATNEEPAVETIEEAESNVSA